MRQVYDNGLTTDPEIPLSIDGSRSEVLNRSAVAPEDARHFVLFHPMDKP